MTVGSPRTACTQDGKEFRDVRAMTVAQMQQHLDDCAPVRRAARAAKAAQNALIEQAARARGAMGKGGFPAPNRAPEPAHALPGCPPNCGNDNPTGPAGVVNVPAPSSGDQLVAGSGGVASSF